MASASDQAEQDPFCGIDHVFATLMCRTICRVVVEWAGAVGEARLQHRFQHQDRGWCSRRLAERLDHHTNERPFFWADSTTLRMLVGGGHAAPSASQSYSRPFVTSHELCSVGTIHRFRGCSHVTCMRARSATQKMAHHTLHAAMIKPKMTMSAVMMLPRSEPYVRDRHV